MACLGVIAVLAGTCAATRAATVPDVVPAKTEMNIHVSERLASNVTKAGSRFTFVVAKDVVVDGTTIVAKDAIGQGTVLVAGHAGGQGHEGDLTLRFDSVGTVDGRVLLFDDERAIFRGRNRQLISSLGGVVVGAFVPFAGIGSFFVKGQDVVIEPAFVFGGLLDHVEHIVTATPAPVATPPSATPQPSPTP